MAKQHEPGPIETLAVAVLVVVAMMAAGMTCHAR